MKIIDDLIEREGGYVNIPADRGGATCWGVTEAVARRNGYTGDMRALPRSFAEAVYTHRYINEPGFNAILGVSMPIAEEMIDTGVNMGPSIPGPWLQRILNVLNQESKLFPDLVVDGQIGQATIAALKSVLAKRGKDGETVIMRALDCLQGSRYIEITEKREANEAFIFGWFLNRVAMP